MKEFNFSPKQWVLVRDNDKQKWSLAIFSHYDKESIYSPYRMLLNVGFKQCIPYDGNEQLLNTTNNYVEPYIPKDGDIITRYDQEVLICKNPEKDIDGGYKFHCYAAFDLKTNTLYAYEKTYLIQLELREATNFEKQKLFEALHNDTKDWDAKNKKIINYKWKPDMDEEYYYCRFDNNAGNFQTAVAKWSHLIVDINRLNSNNCFNDWDACLRKCNKLNEIYYKTINNE